MLTCRHCKEPRTFDGRHDRHGHVIFGHTPEQQAARATLEAINHLTIRHPEALEQMNAIISSVTGLSLMLHMTTDAPDHKQKQQRAAGEIVRAFGRVMTDEDIDKAIRKWQNAHHFRDFSLEETTELLRQLRDTLTYADVFQPVASGPTTNGDAT